MMSYEKLQKDIYAMLEKANIPKDYFRVNESRNPTSDGYYFYRINGQYRYVYFERGISEPLCESNNLEDIEYVVIKDIVHSYSFDYELHHRKRFQDTRRVAFKLGLDTMEKIGEPYYSQYAQEIANTLVKSPYNDSPHIQFDCIDVFKAFVNQINLFILRLKNKALYKRIKDLLPQLEQRGHENYDEFFEYVLKEVTEIYTKLKEINFPLSSSMQEEMELALSKADEIKSS